MRNTFSGYCRPTDDEFEQLWATALIVLDANVLLDLYRFSGSTAEDFLGILAQVGDRLWIPHQVGHEYFGNRLDVIEDQRNAYGEISEMLDATLAKLANQLRSHRHPFLDDAENVLQQFGAAVESVKAKIADSEKRLTFLEHDHLLDKVVQLLQGRVGTPSSEKQLAELYAEGQRRFDKKIPPGYRDGKKGDERKYGDLVFWFQIIEHAKAENKDVILVSDDKKEDWWWERSGKTLGPRPELIEEFRSKCGTRFYMYQPDPFMEYAGKYLKRQVKQATIDEIREVRREKDQEVVLQDQLRNNLELENLSQDAERSYEATILEQFGGDSQRLPDLPTSLTYEAFHRIYLSLYRTLREKGASHEDSMRSARKMALTILHNRSSRILRTSQDSDDVLRKDDK